MRKVFLFLILVLTIGISFANPIASSDMKIFAVSNEGQGISADLTLEISKGSGDIWSKVSSLVGTNTQETERISIELAKKRGYNTDNYDYMFGIDSSALEVDGPSAGITMALLILTMFKGEAMPDYVSATGTITEEGNVGSVGGIFEKAKAAAENDIDLFFVPYSNLEVIIKDDEVRKINLSEYAYDNWQMKVIGVRNIDEAIEYINTELDEIELQRLNETNKVEYSPPKTTYPPSLEKLKEYNSSYYVDAQITHKLAKEHLNSSDIDDSQILSYLFEFMKASDNAISDANKSRENNYLYSTANYLFLSNIYSNMITDIATNPNILSSTNYLSDDIATLKEEIDELEDELEVIPVEGYEWNIAAKERLLWAKMSLAQIETLDVVIGNGYDKKSINIGKIEKYEYAKEWIKIAKMFRENYKLENRELKSFAYESSAKSILDEVIKADSLIESYSINDVERRIFGLETSISKGWYFSAIYEGATTLAIVNSRVESQNKTLDELEAMVQEKIDSISDIEDTNFIWPNLYFAHAKYFYEGSKFHKNEQQFTEAKTFMKSAYEMLVISENLYSINQDIESNKLAISKLRDVSERDREPVKESVNSSLIAIIVFLVLGLIIGGILAYKRFRHESVYETALNFNKFEILKSKEALMTLDKKYIKGKVSDEEYNKISSKLKRDIKRQEKERDKLLDTLEDIESLESELDYLNSKLKSTTSLFKKGLLSQGEYKKRISRYKKEISKVNYELKGEERELMKDIRSRDK